MNILVNRAPILLTISLNSSKLFSALTIKLRKWTEMPSQVLRNSDTGNYEVKNFVPILRRREAWVFEN